MGSMAPGGNRTRSHVTQRRMLDCRACARLSLSTQRVTGRVTGTGALTHSPSACHGDGGADTLAGFCASLAPRVQVQKT